MGPAAKDDVEHTMVLEHVNPTTRLLEKRRLMRETEETLDARKAEYKLKEQGFKRREEALKRKDLELQESLVRFSKFLQENDAKRTAAERKAAEEIKLRLQKEMEIRELTRMQENLRNDLDDAKDEVGRNLRYERYLTTVLEAPDGSYGEIQDLLNRHKTLRVTNEDLRARDAALNADADATRARLHAYTKRMTDERLNLNNDIAKLKKRLEAATLEVERARKASAADQQSSRNRTLEHGRAVAAAENLFQRCRQRSNATTWVTWGRW
ncbi:predicted protein [Micromonas commoda]|uniref:DUF4200 domain-containing protein n=1 Tax=Micromonas commoda (strain RCC299 / NOUM17 / CCMP2709) TaxID=296587 RepID=C1EBE9_MICCC|nr:predicted protein [Micromonas commoda]ACO65370.1 predicted protein [Micromonas commoda]|eukprot:XP_002504112.1 predicted protein [Micromonas commoda]